MAKFFDVIGFGETTKTAPGVHGSLVTERKYRGDVVRNAKSVNPDDKVNSDISVDVSISIVADQYAKDHVFAIRYVRWAGALWIVAGVDIQIPRLILRLGGVYNGPTPGTA